MPVSASDPQSTSAALRWRNASPVRGFILGVYLGGFVAWIILLLVIVATEIAEGGSVGSTPFIPMTVAFAILYCTAIIVVFFFLPMVALKLGRRNPARSWQICLSISILSSVVIWSMCLFLMDVPKRDLLGPVFVASAVCSIIGGAVAGCVFWKKSFPPLADLSGVFR